MADKMNNTQGIFEQALHFFQTGEEEKAISLCQKILGDNPRHANALHLLAGIAHGKGQHRQAIDMISQAVAIAPRTPLFHFNLGIIHKSVLEFDLARAAFEKALALKPDYAEAWNELGLISYEQGSSRRASGYFQNALKYNPNFAAAWNNLGNIIKDQGRLQEAIAYFRNALRHKPDYAEAHNNLGNMLDDTGRKEEAAHHLREACRLKPGLAEARSNLLFLLSYNVMCSPRQMLEESRLWDQAHGNNPRFSHAPKGDPNQRLRIGYVSPDLKRHAVSYFLEPILAHHNPQQVEVFCYAEVRHPDEVTKRLQGIAHHWRSTIGLDDEAAARMIRDDGIHILVDLAGHTAHSRLRVFTFKPAPVQIAYLGYCTTTGLDTMDYWITDEILHPDDTAELATESIYRLPRCWLAFRPDENAPPVIPRLADQALTFGCFNDLSKITPRVIALWSEILHAVPSSHLTLKTRALADPRTRAQLSAHFAEHGIDAKRLTLLPATRDYLAAYHDIDIALDPFPRTGGATTADALWMGVPVITLAGERYIERQGASMLSALKLDKLIAVTRQEYKDKAVSLAMDAPRLEQLRLSLRQRMESSPLCDYKGLSHALENAYRDIWKKHLRQEC